MVNVSKDLVFPTLDGSLPSFWQCRYAPLTLQALGARRSNALGLLIGGKDPTRSPRASTIAASRDHKTRSEIVSACYSQPHHQLALMSVPIPVVVMQVQSPPALPRSREHLDRQCPPGLTRSEVAHRYPQVQVSREMQEQRSSPESAWVFPSAWVWARARATDLRSCSRLATSVHPPASSI